MKRARLVLVAGVVGVVAWGASPVRAQDAPAHAYVGVEKCKMCHNSESPTFKEFDFKTALAKIAHPNPAKGAAK